MKQTFIILYELAAPGMNREALIKKIKAYGAWARLSDSAYLISVSQTDVVSVRDNLSAALRQNDRLYVGVAPAPSAWQGLPEEVSKWIVANQK